MKWWAHWLEKLNASLAKEPPKPALHELHRWHSITDTCGYCGGRRDNGRHLVPLHRPLTIYDAALPSIPGSIIDIVNAACYVDANAVVYEAERYPYMVFIELTDAALYHRASAEVWLRKTLWVMVVFVGLGRLESERYETKSKG